MKISPLLSWLMHPSLPLDHRQLWRIRRPAFFWDQAYSRHVAIKDFPWHMFCEHVRWVVGAGHFLEADLLRGMRLLYPESLGVHMS